LSIVIDGDSILLYPFFGYLVEIAAKLETLLLLDIREVTPSGRDKMKPVFEKEPIFDF
jgi:hypothetical protein